MTTPTSGTSNGFWAVCGFAAVALGTMIPASSVRAAPVANFFQHFTAAGELGGFDSQATLRNPGAGGVDGTGDGYLQIERGPTPSRLGAHSSSSDFAGNWLAAGIHAVQLGLNDVGADQDLEIHFCIGNQDNLWQYDVGFRPPDQSWGSFVVDLTDSTKFTHIISGVGGFAKALQEATLILVRHDRAPYSQSPDLISGEFGLDEIRLLADIPVPVRPVTWGALRSMYR